MECYPVHIAPKVISIQAHGNSVPQVWEIMCAHVACEEDNEQEINLNIFYIKNCLLIVFNKHNL